MSVVAADFGRVALLMGGWAAEREISLISGEAVHQAMLARGIDVVAIDVGRDIVDVLSQGKFDRVFNILHGRGGEDGVVQGLLETLQLPYTGCGVMSSAIGMDKFRCKRLWQAFGLPTPQFVMLREDADLEKAQALGFPLMIKPTHEGSSIGLAKVDDAEQLNAAWIEAQKFDRDVMAERWITGSEYTIGILGDQALPVICLKTSHEFYDYEAKYNANDTEYLIPSGLTEDVEKELQVLALRAFESIDGSGWGRVDLMTDSEGYPWLIEVNTVPGMTSHSLVPMAANAVGIDFEELVWQILAQTLEA